MGSTYDCSRVKLKFSKSWSFSNGSNFITTLIILEVSHLKMKFLRVHLVQSFKVTNIGNKKLEKV